MVEKTSRKNTSNTEEEICIQCGFCCDGTLFGHANVFSGEIIREDLKNILFSTEESLFFKLPCPHFKRSCSVYHEKKPQICSAFRCQILVNFKNKLLTSSEALKIIVFILSVLKGWFSSP